MALDTHVRNRRPRPWRSLVQLWYLLFRSDVFISYTRSDGGRHYAHALASELRKRGYDPLMDTFEARVGQETPEELLDQMRRCMQLVVVASPGAIVSTEVAREIELFPKRNRSIVILEFEQNVRGAPWYQRYLVGLPPVPAGVTAGSGSQRGGLRVVECEEELASRPAAPTIDLILDAFVYKRGRFRRAVVAGATVALFFAAIGSLLRVTSNYQETAQKLSRTEVEVGNEQAKLREEQNKVRAEQAKTTKAVADRTEAERLAEIAKSTRDQAEKQQKIALARLAAINALDGDPYLAYRLAEYVYNLEKGEQDEQLLRRAASRARFPYQREFPGCRLASSRPPWTLLACPDSGKSSNGAFRVVNVETGMTEASFRGGDLRQGWLVRRNTSWRAISFRWEELGGVGIPNAYAWDPPVEAGNETPTELVRRAYLKDCGGDRLISDSRIGPWYLLVAATGRTITIPTTAHDLFASCREDGSFLIARRDGFESYSEDGTSQGVRPWADRPAYGDSRRWSPDGRFLALYGRGELQVLDTETGRASTLSPDGYIETAYTWYDKHTLIAAGHTLDHADYQIRSFDPQSLGQQTILSERSLVRDLGILPDGLLAILEESGALEAVSLKGNGESWRGYHQQAWGMSLVGSFLLTDGETGVRQWPVRPATANWVFRSTADSSYFPSQNGAL